MLCQICPFIRNLPKRRADVTEQAAVFMIGASAHPLAAHVHKASQVTLIHDFCTHAKRQQHGSILSRYMAAFFQIPACVADAVHHGFVPRKRLFILRDCRGHDIGKLIIIDIPRACLQACRRTAQMCIPFPDYTCRVAVQHHLYIYVFHHPSMPAGKAFQPALIVFILIGSIRPPADPGAAAHQRDWIFCCFFQNSDPAHISLPARYYTF